MHSAAPHLFEVLVSTGSWPYLMGLHFCELVHCCLALWSGLVTVGRLSWQVSVERGSRIALLTANTEEVQKVLIASCCCCLLRSAAVASRHRQQGET